MLLKLTPSFNLLPPLNILSFSLDWHGGRSGKRRVRLALLAEALGTDVVINLAVVILVVFILAVVSFVTGSHVVFIVSFILVVPLFLPSFAPAIMFALTILPIIPLDVTFLFDNLSDVNGLSRTTGDDFILSFGHSLCSGFSESLCSSFGHGFVLCGTIGGSVMLRSSVVLCSGRLREDAGQGLWNTLKVEQVAVFVILASVLKRPLFVSSTLENLLTNTFELRDSRITRTSENWIVFDDKGCC